MSNFIFLPSPSPFTVLQTISHTAMTAQNLYGDFNLGLHVLDEPINVHQNRMALLNSLKTAYPQLNSIHWLNQVHGNEIYDNQGKLLATPINADAQITTQKNTALAIMTADCVPVMIADGDGRVVGAVHAGWQGLAKDIIRLTVKKMQQQSDNVANFSAWVGACIAQCNYEVDEKVKTAVLATLDLTVQNDESLINRLFIRTMDGHYLANLAKIAELQLNACGIHQVYQSQLDSYADDRLYSYRLQSQKKYVATGRMATLIFINQ